MSTDQFLSAMATLTQATEALGVNLSCSRQYFHYRAAADRLHNDMRASAILQELGELQAELRTRQMQGTLTSEDINQLRSLQGEAQRNPVITEYVQAQQVVVDTIRDVNQEISGWLGVDFATLARTPGRC